MDNLLHSTLHSNSGYNGLVGWLFWVYRPFQTVFQSISGRLPKRGRNRRKRIRIDESKNVQTTPTRTYCKCSRPLPYCNPICRTPRHWKFTQHHRTTRPPPGTMDNLLHSTLHSKSGYNGQLVTFYITFQYWNVM